MGMEGCMWRTHTHTPLPSLLHPQPPAAPWSGPCAAWPLQPPQPVAAAADKAVQCVKRPVGNHTAITLQSAMPAAPLSLFSELSRLLSLGEFQATGPHPHIRNCTLSHLLIVIDALDLRPVSLLILLSPAPVLGGGRDGRREAGAGSQTTSGSGHHHWEVNCGGV